MVGKAIDWKFAGDEASEQAAKDAARTQRIHDAKHAPGPDLSHQACACGAFGPWGDGAGFYCERHVPPEIRFAGQFFAEMME